MEDLSAKIAGAWQAAPAEGRNPRFELLLEEIALEEGTGAPAYATALNEYASYLRVNGLYDQGAQMFERALAAIGALDGKRTAYATCLSNYAELRRLQGDYEACARMLEEARPLYGSRESVEYAANLNYQAHLYESLGKSADALAVQAESLSIVEKVEPDSPDLACAYQNLGTARMAQGDLERALAELQEAARIYEKLGISANAHVVALENSLGTVYGELGRREEGLRHFERALELMDQCKMNPDDRALVERNAERYREL